MAYAGASAPSGWLLCNGAAVSRMTYATLFGIIGTTYGVGNGNTTFRLPDLRGRFPLGLDNMGGTSAGRVAATAADTRGGSSGAETHTLTVAEMPDHDHRLKAKIDNQSLNYDPQHRFSMHRDRTGRTGWGRSGNMENTGGDQPHNNMPPYLTLNYIIKT